MPATGHDSPKSPMESNHSLRKNAATRFIASTLGVLVGVGSIDHGLLECLQGPRPTPGLIVNALGAGIRWTIWKQGGEGAFTLIPNFCTRRSKNRPHGAALAA